MLILLVVFLLIAGTFEKCGFDIEKQKKINVKKLNLWGNEGRFLEATNWSPIRISLDFAYLDSQKGQVSDDLIANIKSVMNNVVTVYQNLIQVKPAPNPIITSDCDKITIVSNVLKTTGLAADLVIIPYVDFSFADTTEAAAGYCYQDNKSNRPIIGSVGFNKAMSFSKKNAMYYNSMLVLHETNHILSFNSALFEEFKDSSGNLIPLTSVVKEKTVNGESRKYIITPKVLEKARNYFNCPNLDGVQLEVQGGAGTAGSHWEERVMAGDFMIGESYEENVMSEITLALLEDSGWYKVNYYTGGLFRYGKHQGCEFLNENCIQNEKTKFPNEFSVKTSVPMCYSGRTARGTSSLITGLNIKETYYKYWEDQTKGGQVPLSDYCPIAIAEDVDGYFFGNSCWMGLSKLPESMGEKIGPNSSCFISSLTPQNDNSVVDLKGKPQAICYEVSCNASDSTYTVSIGKNTIKCQTAGGITTVPNFDGNLYCVDYNLICTKNVQCNDVLDCVSKKATPLSAIYNYNLNITQNMDNSTSSNIPSSGKSTSYSRFYSINLMILALLIFLF